VDWRDDLLTRRGKKSTQRWLVLKTREVLPGREVMEEFRHPQLLLEQTGSLRAELDVFVPELRLGLEFHGQQHFEDLAPASFSPLELYQTRDREKRELCRKHNITLVEVPYWWDLTASSLRVSLREAALLQGNLPLLEALDESAEASPSKTQPAVDVDAHPSQSPEGNPAERHEKEKVAD
jgi:hypothetical protein